MISLFRDNIFRARDSEWERLLVGVRDWINCLSESLLRKRFMKISTGWLDGKGLGSLWEGGRKLLNGWEMGVGLRGLGGWDFQKARHRRFLQKFRASVRMLTGLILGVGEKESPFLRTEISSGLRSTEERLSTSRSVVGIEGGGGLVRG